MKRGAKVGLAFVGGALAIAAMSRGKQQGGFAVVGTTTQGGAGPVPSPPTQGNGFRMGAQPDPAAPNDSNRGRNFLIMEQSRNKGSVAQGSFRLFDLPMTANGRVEVRVWAARAGKPERCSLWVGSAKVSEGRIVYPGSWNVPKPQICGAQHVTYTDPGGCSVKLPIVNWEQQGPSIALTWRTEVSDDGFFGGDDCDEDLQFYVDAFWKWIPS